MLTTHFNQFILNQFRAAVLQHGADATLKCLGVEELLVEQNAFMALEVSHRGYVIERGRVMVEGPAQTIADDPQAKAAYLGG